MTQLPRAVAIALSAIVLLIIGLSLYAVQQAQQAPAATALPTAIIPTAAMETPTAVSRSTPAILTSATQFTGRRTNYSVLIPAGWAVVDPADHGGYLEKLTSAANLPELTRAFDLLAYDAQNSEAAAQITIATVERNGLGVADYLALLAEELQPNGEVDVQIDHTVRADGLPVGVINYTAPEGSAFNQQVVLIDDSGNHFIIISYAAQEAKTEWRAILQSITFN